MMWCDECHNDVLSCVYVYANDTWMIIMIWMEGIHVFTIWFIQQKNTSSWGNDLLAVVAMNQTWQSSVLLIIIHDMTTWSDPFRMTIFRQEWVERRAAQLVIVTFRWWFHMWPENGNPWINETKGKYTRQQNVQKENLFMMLLILRKLRRRNTICVSFCFFLPDVSQNSIDCMSQSVVCCSNGLFVLSDSQCCTTHIMMIQIQGYISFSLSFSMIPERITLAFL